MSGLELLLVGVAAIATSALTAVAGAGGGLILLIVILQFVDPVVAIPAHGVVQMLSNGTRAVTLRADAQPALLRWYLPLLVPATVLGYLIADAAPRSAGRAVIGVFALLAVWWPAATAWLAPGAGTPRRLALVGAVAVLANPSLGATVPLLAPAWRTVTRDHVAFVSTFAEVQTINHLVKVAVFAAAGYAWRDNLPLIVVAGLGVILGTRVAARHIRRFDPALLGRLFQVAATAGALRLVASIWG